ncbi:Rossmann-like domain-containing protein [Terrisporobacter petrolearius]|uniref:Rossmann-like domain-containing protein n=1 Tax=Terrisporobacter petrolearius TaxID=1460447 RepID=UPI0022E38A35|nr:DUF364 domain-containing protein [Terrisporobacter petrolearius]
MTKEELFQTLHKYFEDLIKENNLDNSDIVINSKTLTPQEAIGIVKRKDFPIIVGKDVMVQAEFQGAIGQAFTDSPSAFRGNLKEILQLDLLNDSHGRGLFLASLNAVMCKLNMATNTIHCKNNDTEICAEKFADYVRENFENKKIALIGYQPAILEHLAKENNIRVLDLNPDMVGQNKYGVLVEDGAKDYENVVINWSDVVLCTGSTLCNGSLVNFIDIEKEVVFFGTTIAGAANIFDLKRACFCSQ